MLSKNLLLLLPVIAAASSQAALAQRFPRMELQQQGAARERVNEGRAIPFSTIKRNLEAQFGGRLSDTNLYATGAGGYVYEVTWITGDGRKLIVEVDAQTGQILSTRG